MRRQGRRGHRRAEPRPATSRLNTPTSVTIPAIRCWATWPALAAKATAGADALERRAQAFTVAATGGSGRGGRRAGRPVVHLVAMPRSRPAVRPPALPPRPEPSHALLTSGRVTACTQCAARRDIGLDDVLPGVRVAGAAVSSRRPWPRRAQGTVPLDRTAAVGRPGGVPNRPDISDELPTIRPRPRRGFFEALPSRRRRCPRRPGRRHPPDRPRRRSPHRTLACRTLARARCRLSRGRGPADAHLVQQRRPRPADHRRGPGGSRRSRNETRSAGRVLLLAFRLASSRPARHPRPPRNGPAEQPGD